MPDLIHTALLLPHTDRTMETDLQSGESGIILHTQRMWLEDVSELAEQRMLEEEFPRALRYLKQAGPYDCAVFGCTSASVSKGQAGMEELEKTMERELGCPAITAFGAVLRAIRQRNVRRIAVLTPYIEEVNLFFRKTMEQFGVEVTMIEGMNLLRDEEISAAEPGEILAFARMVAGKIPPSSELVFFSCTNVRAAEIRKDLEEILGHPVITTNTSVMEYLTEISGML